MNLNQNDKALSCYSKAVSKADKNPEIVPLILIKEANIYRAEEKYADEAKCYKEILDEYPVYVQESRTDIRKYYERALAQSKKLNNHFPSHNNAKGTVARAVAVPLIYCRYDTNGR